MSGESTERRKAPSQETLENTVAIAKLTEITSNLTKDTDRLVRHIEKVLPLHEKISNLKKIVYVGLSTASMFSVWVTIEQFELKDSFHTFTAVQEKENADLSKDITYNKNQIQYLKGRIKQ